MGEEYKRSIAYELEKETEWKKKHPGDEEKISKLGMILILIAAAAFFLDSPYRYIVWVLLLGYYVYQRCK